MKTLRCDKTSGSDCPVTQRYIPEEWKSQTSVRSIKTVKTTCSLREVECLVLYGTVFLQRVAFSIVVTETVVDVTNEYLRMRGPCLLRPFMSLFIFAIVIKIDGVYGLKRIEFRTNYFRERMGQVLHPALLLSRLQYRVCIATEEV
jgi:hypothetical protein